ncbi:adenine phosphoribosyltransferase [Agromyces luteolus]|uniref:Adenine phosphoribosyltransferase n=1 Tax=Agromyces luteolus TaxID=88373 RepID=A0A7C9I016_9MICO|nr:adenine phosphoribosyltransferase [Agromyces luteolus]MUN07540.1 adenine phosphoribosyltransferase [Agromyces luteolus]GLK29154.1 adenine phosphoribosyltransferase [Agromyces luteolus]
MNEAQVRDLVESKLATIPDFPEPGVVFRDLTPVFADGPAFHALSEALTAPFAGRFDHLAGLEARGFLLAGAASALCGAGVLPIRKAGKLPRAVLREEYDLEYGTAAFEVHEGELPPGSRVLIIDDVLATGGTVEAAAALIERAGWLVAGVSVAIELPALGGRARLRDRFEVSSLLRY